jgi:hypothetical protein
MLLLSALLFVASIWFVIAGIRSSRSAPAGAPVATVKQVMQGIVTPASTVVYGAVSTVISAEGTKETAPQNDAEWARVGSNAAALIEAARLMMEPPRARNNDEWMKMSQAMIDSSARALKATGDKNAEGLLAAGEAINMSCDSCHREYASNLDL